MPNPSRAHVSRSTGVDRYKPAAKGDATTTSELSSKQVMAVIVAHQHGVPPAEIAIGLGVAAKDVEALVRRLEAPDTREAAKQVILAKALPMAERLMETNHGPTMLEVMRDLAITEKKSPAGESKVGMQVFIGLADRDVLVSGNHNPALPDTND